MMEIPTELKREIDKATVVEIWCLRNFCLAEGTPVTGKQFTRESLTDNTWTLIYYNTIFDENWCNVLGEFRDCSKCKYYCNDKCKKLPEIITTEELYKEVTTAFYNFDEIRVNDYVLTEGATKCYDCKLIYNCKMRE